MVLRNEDGVRIQGYSVNLGRCSIEDPEFWAVIHGMKMAASRIRLPLDGAVVERLRRDNTFPCNLQALFRNAETG